MAKPVDHSSPKYPIRDYPLSHYCVDPADDYRNDDRISLAYDPIPYDCYRIKRVSTQQYKPTASEFILIACIIIGMVMGCGFIAERVLTRLDTINQEETGTIHPLSSELEEMSRS
jgi:hypothetical protein